MRALLHGHIDALRVARIERVVRAHKLRCARARCLWVLIPGRRGSALLAALSLHPFHQTLEELTDASRTATTTQTS